MKPQLIVIRGNQETGKTSVAICMYNLLIKHYNLNVDEIKDKIDISWPLFIGNKQVYFLSEGDLKDKLYHNLQKAKEQEPDIIVVCLRSMDREGSSLRMMIEEESDLFSERIEAWTSASNKEELRHPLHMAVASVLVNKIVELLK